MHDDFSKLPPHDIDAEQCLLASMMLDPKACDALRRSVRREDFFNPDHQTIFDSIVSMREANKPMDAVLLRAELQKAGVLEEIGGTAQLAIILNSVPAASHGEHYANIVKAKSNRRRAIATSIAIREAAYGSDDDHGFRDSILAQMQSVIQTMDGGKEAEIRHVSDMLNDAYEAAEKGENSGLIKTDLHDLDELTGGLMLGETVIIAARPSIGKSQLEKQLAVNVAKQAVAAGIVSIEERAVKVSRNLLSMGSGVENNRIRRRQLHQEDWGQLAEACSRMGKLPIWVTDAAYDLASVTGAIRMMVARYGVQVVFVDYLQLVGVEGGKQSREREVASISTALRNLGKQLNVAMVVLAQLSRANESQGIRRPRMSDLRDSGQIEQDADQIWLLHREDYYHRNEQGYFADHKLEVIVAKSKDSEVGTVDLFFRPQTQTVVNWNGGQGDNFIL